uniref:Uncharacterized protein MLCL622.09 n=1 Tax=Mycobacterium leprae TaxID=1769 RepID=O06072_MYCLR|nr:unknown [Mycobacterium leprae]
MPHWQAYLTRRDACRLIRREKPWENLLISSIGIGAYVSVQHRHCLGEFGTHTIGDPSVAPIAANALPLPGWLAPSTPNPLVLPVATWSSGRNRIRHRLSKALFWPPAFNPINDAMADVAKPLIIDFSGPVDYAGMAERAIHISSPPPVLGR